MISSAAVDGASTSDTTADVAQHIEIKNTSQPSSSGHHTGEQTSTARDFEGVQRYGANTTTAEPFFSRSVDSQRIDFLVNLRGVHQNDYPVI